MRKIFLFIFIFFLICAPGFVLGVEPKIIFNQEGEITISDPEVLQIFYDDLKGSPRTYIIDSAEEFDFYISIMVPEEQNGLGRYSADVFLLKDTTEERIVFLNESETEWVQLYDSFSRDYFLKGPEFEGRVEAGRYKIKIFSTENQGKYVLKLGKKDVFNIKTFLNIYWQIPLLKMSYFKTDPLQFFFTPFAIGAIGAIGSLLIFLALMYYLAGVIKTAIKHSEAKTLLLTSAGMQMKSEIIKLLQKPAYDITVGFISTASKQEENLDYLKTDWSTMQEMGFNVEEVDIEGKTESEVMKLLELKDIIFVEGGNTFYLLKAMRKCNFERIIRKLLKFGKVYIGVSAGSIVAGRTIKTAGWKDADKNIVGLRDLRGLNLVPFDIFVHYKPEHASLIQEQIKNPKRRLKDLRILTDEQAILVQGKDIMLIGKGEKIIV